MQAAPLEQTRVILKSVSLGLLLLTILVLAYTVRFVLLAGVIGIGVGVLVSPAMNFMQKRFRLPRGISALILVVTLLGGAVGLGFGLFTLLSDQVDLLVSRAPDIFEGLKGRIGGVLERFPWLRSQADQLNLGAVARRTVQAAFQGVQTSVVVIAGGAVVFFLALYTAINSKAYFQGLLSAFPAYLRPRATEVLRRSAHALRLWFGSQLIVMAIIGSATTLGLWWIGVDYWLLFGVMTAVLGIIPYVGVILTLIVTCLITLASEPGNVPWVIGLFLVTQQLEGNILTPIVMKERVHLPEAHLILIMLVLSSWFGILGAFIAPPLLAVGRTVYLMTYVPKMDQMKKAPSEDAGTNSDLLIRSA